ncbi:hypothetical protein LSTR_LSTR010773 [Laodelphax striatellus]|uniref:Uncharacterized protein n=1 Tax=Laodelphax striatellus TaxID=195883 RepID=A0A482XJ29_LAOST|nr:hypothetical protein LSTR_LSTR010773 [Laodelphax striatellus]
MKLNNFSGERLTKEVNYTLVHREHTKSFFENNIELKHTLTPTSVYRTLINPKGYDIRVGSKVTSTIGSPNDRSRCDKFSVSERATFNTIFKIKIGDGGVWHLTETVKERTNEYFKYVESVSWRCTESRRRYEFYRIINKLEVSIPVRFIETFDGIQIVQKPKDDKVFLEITELKYILTTGAKDTIMYVGKLEFTYSNDRSSHTLECTMVRDCASQFFPGFEAENGTGVVLRKLEKFDDVPTYLSYFKSDFFDLWLCEQQHQLYENTGRATSSRRRKGYRFYRVVTRQSLKKGLEIGEIEYGKRDQVWIEMKNVSMNEYDVLMKQIRYLNATNPSYKTVNYDGYVVFEETRTSRLWKSGTKYMETLDLRKKKKSELRYIPYLLDRKKFGIYKIRGTNNGQPRNESLLIGSQWQAVLDVGSEIYECTKKDTFLENLRSQEKYLTNIIRTEQVGFTGSVLDYFDFKQITIWTCQHEEKEFTRVVNHFTTATDFNRVKQVQYYDGVTILKNITNRRNDDPLEIIEVKYLDESRNRVLKFLGKLKFVDASDKDIKPISFTTLTDVYKLSTEFDFLSPKEVYKTYVIGNKGSIVEVGQYYENELGASSIMCEYTTLTKEESQKLELEPKVAIVEESEESKDLLGRKVIKNTDLKNYFNIEKQFWNCTYGRSEYIRVHNKLTWTRKKSLHAIHHFDGVTVDVDGKSVEIEEIKYVRRDDSVEHKFGGFVKFKESATGTNQKPPECRQEQGHVYRESWRTTIKRLKLSTEKNNDLVWNYVSPKVIFDNVEQELWSCKKGQETVFYRVVIRMSLSKQPISMYYHDGVSIQTSTFYDRTVVQQITEVKFLKNKEDVLFKKYESGNGEIGEFAGRAYHDKTPLIAYVESIDFNFATAPVLMTMTTPLNLSFYWLNWLDERRMNWPLNSLMHYALLKYKEADDTRKFRMVNVTDVEVREKRQFQTTIVGSGIRVVQIGTFWEEKIESNTGVMRCTLDDITYVYGLRYMPKVVELIDKKAYLLSDDDFLELFKVKNMKVWLCTNKVDKIIRVVSQLEGKVPFFAIRHTDAVTLEIDANTHKVNANETIYINALNSKVVKYDGAFSLLEKVPDSENQEKKTT